MLILNFTYPLRCLRVPPVEYHWSNKLCPAVPLMNFIPASLVLLHPFVSLPMDQILSARNNSEVLVTRVTLFPFSFSLNSFDLPFAHRRVFFR